MVSDRAFIFHVCVFSPLTSAEACEKNSGFGKKSCVGTGMRKPENT